MHVLDIAPLDGSDPADNFATVEAELRLHGHGLAELPRILALSKVDLVPEETARAAVADWSERLRDSDVRAVIPTSAATGAGLDELAAAIFAHVPAPEQRPEEDAETPATHRVYRPGRGDAVRVERTPSGAFRIAGEGVERLIARHDLDNEEALRYVEERLRTLGVIRALEAAGFEPGDDVEIGGRDLRARSRRPVRLIEQTGPMLRPLLMLLLAVTALALAACGDDDKEDIQQTVRDFVSASSEPDPEAFCGEIVTQEFLEQATGATGDRAEDECRRQLEEASGVDAELVQIRSTEIDGDEATVRAVIKTQGRSATQTLRLEQEDGRWKLSGGGP